MTPNNMASCPLSLTTKRVARTPLEEAKELQNCSWPLKNPLKRWPCYEQAPAPCRSLFSLNPAT